jgi:hypothetical protein
MPLHLAQHQIELDINILASHQTWYRMNLNYAMVMKRDLDKVASCKIHRFGGGGNLVLFHCGGIGKE